MDRPQEVARRLVVARGNSAVLLEPGKKVLNEVALLVQVFVVAARLLAVAARGDHDSVAFGSAAARSSAPAHRRLYQR